MGLMRSIDDLAMVTTNSPLLGPKDGLWDGCNDGNPDGICDETLNGSPDTVSLGSLDGR